MILDVQKFITQRRAIWDEYEAVLEKLGDHQQTQLTLPEIKRLRFLQDSVAADLTKLRTYASDPATAQYLESLLANGFGLMHENRASGRFSFNPVTHLVNFAITVRKHAKLLLIASMAMFVGSLLGFGIIAFNPQAKEVILPFAHLLGDPSDRVAMEESGENGGAEAVSEQQASFSAMLMTHNIRVSILALTIGLLYGVFTVIILFYNGIILGAVALDYVLAGESVFLVGWLLPHGSVEIPAILFAGQGGLILAKAVLVKDGRLSVGARLKAVSKDVVTIIVGVALLLIWAGIIEAFLSQYHEPTIPYVAKIAFGLIQLAGLAAFMMLAGRKREAEPA